VKVPAIANRPGAVPQGKVCDALLSQYDFMPTLLDYLGLDNPAETVRLPGASFAAVLRGQDAPHRESVVVYDEYGPVRMIRSRQWKYVHRYPYGPHELYDLAADPDERVNLYGRAEHAECQHDMRARLEGWFTCYVDPLRDGTHEAVTGMGQLGLCGPAANGEDSFADDWHYVGPDGEDRGKTPPAG
jgi:arylsulfatase A-like enzyme